MTWYMDYWGAQGLNKKKPIETKFNGVDVILNNDLKKECNNYIFISKNQNVLSININEVADEVIKISQSSIIINSN